MIKTGDKLLIKGEVYIIQNESYNDNKVEAKCMSELKFVEMEFDTALGYAFAYEKQRADELEKRWSELKNKVEAISISLGTTGRMDSYIMYIHILDTMQQLLEDNNA